MEDFNSKYSGEQVEALLDQVASGNAGGGGGGITEVYIADFTMESLRNGIYNITQVDCDMQALVAAMNANKIILVRESEDSAYKGVHVLNGYTEDFLYFSIVDSEGNVLYCEGTDYLNTQNYIDGQSLRMRSWNDKQDNLISGENIKTINGESILGEGDFTIAGGSGEKGDKGDTGVGVQSVKQTTTSNVDSGYNVVTVTLTDGTTSTFSVKNGSKGSQGVQGEQGEKGDKGDKGDTGANGTNGKDGTDGATFTPSVDSAGNLSWTNNKGLANPPTVNIKGPKGDVGSGEVATKEIIYVDDGVIEELEPNKVYILRANLSTMIAEIQSIVEPEEDYGEYSVVISAVDEGGYNRPISLTLPSDVMWPNGVVPDMSQPGYYELSITYWATASDSGYNAVLTRFNYAE